MKTKLTIILLIISLLGAAFSNLWMIISYINYLVDKVPFIWKSFYSELIFLGICTICFLICIKLFSIKQKEKENDKLGEWNYEHDCWI